MNTSDVDANMTKDRHLCSRGISTIACTFEASEKEKVCEKEKIKTQLISISRNETAHNENTNFGKDVSFHTENIEYAKNVRRPISSAATINDECDHDDDGLIFQLDGDDDWNFHPPKNNLLIEKKTSDVELFDESFEALSVDRLSASLFEKLPSDNKFIKTSSSDEEKRFNKPNTPRSSTPLKSSISRIPNIGDKSQGDNDTCESLANGKHELLKPSTFEDDDQLDESHNGTADPIISIIPPLDDKLCIKSQDDDVNETVCLLDSDDYDESDNGCNQSSESHLDMSPSNFLLTVDDINCFKRSCATASSCSLQSDFGSESSKEIADVVDNGSLSLDSSYSESEDEGEPEHDKDDKLGNNVSDNKDKDSVLRGKKTSPQMLKARHKSSRTSTSDKSRLYIPPAVRASYAPNVTWPNSAAPTPNRHRSTRKRDVRVNAAQKHQDLIKPYEVRQVTRTLFDPYAERRLSSTLPAQSKRYDWNFDSTKNERKKTPKEEWPALHQLRSPSSTDAIKQRSKQPTYAQILNKPKPKPKQLKKSAKEKSVSYKSVVKPTEDNTLPPKGDEDTGPPCSGELLVSNSITTFNLNKDGSTSLGVHQGKHLTSSTSNEDQKRDQKATDFQDPAIVGMSTKYQVPPYGIELTPGRSAATQNSICDKSKVFSLLFRPAVQQEDPAIVGVHHAVAVMPLDGLERNIPRHTQFANAPVTSKKQADIDDPAIIYACRNNTCPTLSSSSLAPQPTQTGFWSVQENIANSNRFVTSNPLMNQDVLTNNTYSTACQVNFMTECPGYIGGYYPLNACMLAAPSVCTSGVVCHC